MVLKKSWIVVVLNVTFVGKLLVTKLSGGLMCVLAIFWNVGVIGRLPMGVTGVKDGQRLGMQLGRWLRKVKVMRLNLLNLKRVKLLLNMF